MVGRITYVPPYFFEISLIIYLKYMMPNRSMLGLFNHRFKTDNFSDNNFFVFFDAGTVD